MRQRSADLLRKLADADTVPDEVRTGRALEALELIGNDVAREHLARLAKGAPGAWLTREAQAALQRVERRVAKQ